MLAFTNVNYSKPKNRREKLCLEKTRILYFHHKVFLWICLTGLPLLFTAAKGSAQTRSKKAVTTSSTAQTEIATLAGGCFWCVESDLETLPGVKEVISGYTGGHKSNPTYKEVSSGTTGHQEAVQVIFDPKQISYGEILNVFWKKINPLDDKGQFVDRGFQYTSGIFYHTKKQKQMALQSKKELEAGGPFKGQKIATPIQPFTVFYKAEDYHQDYYKKNSFRYKFYRYRSQRDQWLSEQWESFKDFRLLSSPKSKKPTAQSSVPLTINSQLEKAPAKAGISLKPTVNLKPEEYKGSEKIPTSNTSANAENSSPKLKINHSEKSSQIPSSPAIKSSLKSKGKKKPSKEELKRRLTPLQYHVTQEEGTEKPFANEYWNNKKEGIYVDVISGEPLFSSLDKYNSGSGWPSFTKPLVPENITTKKDFKLLYPRTEVLSKKWSSHLGHVFKDGPPPRGLRYCINSAALRFIAKNKLKEEGYEKFTALFENPDSQ